MGLHYLIDHRQSETSSTFKLRLEGFEYFFSLLRCHPCPCIRKTHLPVVSQVFDRHLESAAIAHSANRVLSKIPKDLLNSVSVGQHPRLRSRKLAFDGDARTLRGHTM